MEPITRVAFIAALALVLGTVDAVSGFTRAMLCVKSAMLSQYTEMHAARCDNCHLYFHCQASRVAHAECEIGRYVTEITIAIRCVTYLRSGSKRPQSVQDLTHLTGFCLPASVYCSPVARIYPALEYSHPSTL